MWPCIVTNFLIIEPNRCNNFSNLFWNETLHVSDSSSVHHQELFTVHSATGYVIQVCRQLSSSRIRILNAEYTRKYKSAVVLVGGYKFVLGKNMDLKYYKTASYLVLSNTCHTLTSRFTWLEYINISVKTATEWNDLFSRDGERKGLRHVGALFRFAAVHKARRLHQ
jgi:hypothetical protein